jgi:hypothetical protein
LERLSQFHNSVAFITGMNVLQHSKLLCGAIIGERQRKSLNVLMREIRATLDELESELIA